MEDTIDQSRISQPDVCRCCLTASGTWDLTAPYLSDTGVKEMFTNNLRESFGLSLSLLNEWGASRLICQICINHLRDATSFQKQVVQADRLYTQFWLNRKDLISHVTVKIEKPTESENDMEYINDNSCFFTKSNANLKSDSRPKRKSKIRKNVERSIEEYDSDTPIAQLKNDSSHVDNRIENDIIDQNSCHIKEMKLNECHDKVENKLTGYIPTRLKHNNKQVSQRKRVRVTCGTVLKETTACPFRHHKSWFQCFFCTQEFMEINLLRNHTLESHSDIASELKKITRYPRSLQIEISNLNCRICESNLTDIDAMTRHFVDVHNKLIYKECIADYKVNASPYTCHLCKREFHVFRTLTTHLNEHYANCICDVCGKSFINSNRLKVHKRTHENGVYPCGECGKVLKTKTSKSNHMESAHSKRIIKCQICLKPMKHYNDRIKHMSEVHNITHKFKCPFCDREYNIKHYLATHIRQTHGHKNKKCSECGMAFITNHSLKKHMSKHTGERPFTCGICSKSYARSYTLKEHMRAHGNDK